MRLAFHFFALLSSVILLAEQSESYRPKQGEFPSLKDAKFHRGELVFGDHINRRGSLRIFTDGYFRERRLHHFAMLPYGMIYYHGAPADLRDIPLGTILYGDSFWLRIEIFLRSEFQWERPGTSCGKPCPSSRR